MTTQNPHVHKVYPDKDEVRGWFFHPGGKYDILISDAVLFRGVDCEPPAKVADVKIRTDAGKATLSWHNSADNTLTVWYRVAAGGEPIADMPALSVTLPLAKFRGRPVAVQAVDFFENFSEPSDPVTAR